MKTSGGYLFVKNDGKYVGIGRLSLLISAYHFGLVTVVWLLNYSL